ncbi:MAG: CotH kinase family protein, partial [Anaerolineae bacterium]
RVEMRTDGAPATIIFTTDGSRPSPASATTYRGPIQLDARAAGVTVLRAARVVDGVAGSDVTAVYVVGLDTELPVLSLVVDPDDLWHPERGVLANPSFRGDEWERSSHVTFYDGGDGFSLPAGVRIHGTEPVETAKQSLRLYFRNEHGASRLEYELFPDHPQQPTAGQPVAGQSYKRLLLQAGDRTGWWTLFRDELVVRAAGSLGLPAAQGRFVHLFINGRSWGLYRMSERVDRWYLDDNFGYQDVDVVQEGRPREGDDEAWDALVDWVVAHDLSEPAAYERVRAQIDVANFVDFAILQLYFGFSPEDLYAVRNRGGSWHFVYAGGAQEFVDRPETMPPALGTEDSDFALLLHAMLDNYEFRDALMHRGVGILNTVLAPEAVSQNVTILADELSEDIHFEEMRWPSLSSWQENVEMLHRFVAARPSVLMEILSDPFGLGPSIEAEIISSPQDGGRVFLEGLPLEGPVVFPRGMTVELIAAPQMGFEFAGWEGAPTSGTSVMLPWNVDQPREIRARFELASAGGQGLRPEDVIADDVIADDVIADDVIADDVIPDDVIINEFWISDDGTQYESLEGRPITGDWIELLVRGPKTVDLRGWRLTDNNSKDAEDEGSLIFPDLAALEAVPRGTVILILATRDLENDAFFPVDDLDHRDKRMILYVGNGNLDASKDPGFRLDTGNDNLVLLAPGADGEEIGIDFVAEGTVVTPYSFGVLADGVYLDAPFWRLGRDDGCVFTGAGSNDDPGDWIVDPPACESGDAVCWGVANVLSPGKLNEGQQLALAQAALSPWWTLCTK